MDNFLLNHKTEFAIALIALVNSLFTKGFLRMLSILLLLCCVFYLIGSVIKPERSLHYTWRFVSEFSLVYVASYIGLKCYRNMTMFQRLMLLQVWLYFFVYLITWVVKFDQLAHGIKPNTIVVYDLYLPVEAGILLFTPAILLKRRMVFFSTSLLFLLFLLIHLIEIYNREAMLFNDFSIVIQNMLVTGCALYLLYGYFSRNALNWENEPDLWLLAGLTIYSACIIPYCSMMDQLQTVAQNKLHLPDKNTNTFLYYLIVGALANIRYGCMAITFYLLYKAQRNKMVNE